MKCLFWVGCFPPEVHSVGDHAQTLAVEKFLNNHFSDYNVKRFSRTETDKFFKESVDKDDLIFIHSGGDFGDLYVGWHDTRKDIIAKYPQNRIVQLPVSVFYRSPVNFESDKIFFSDKTNVLILCRSKEGAELLKGNFGCRVEFFPDFAFYLKPPLSNAKRKGYLVAFRRDSESAIMRKAPRKIMRRYIRNVINFMLQLDFNRRVSRMYPDGVIFDPQVSNVDITDANREQVINDAFRVYQRFEYVVTDRFHACVFAYLTQTPFKTIPGKIEQKTIIDTSLDYEGFFNGFRDLVFQEPQHSIKDAIEATNDVFAVIKSRRSIRKWLPQQVEPWKLKAVIEAGVYAPSAANTQAVKLKATQALSDLKFICANTSPWFRNNMPAAAILVVYDVKKAQACGLKMQSWHNRFAWQDTSCASMNMILAAESLGLKSCWASFSPEQQKPISKRFGFHGILTNAVFLGYSDQKVNVNKAIHQGRPIRRVNSERELPSP